MIKRWVVSGNKDGRDWTMRNAMIAGIDGVVQRVILAEKDTACPARGQLAMIPCFIGANGQLREARDMGAEF